MNWLPLVDPSAIQDVYREHCLDSDGCARVGVDASGYFSIDPSEAIMADKFLQHVSAEEQLRRDANDTRS